MEIREIQGYAYFIMTVVFVVGLYAYIVYLYKGKNRGTDYEKYSDLALNDKLDDDIVEATDEKGTSRQ
jgi:cytochrome c oxidase cbb3-type subunit 4